MRAKLHLKRAAEPSRQHGNAFPHSLGFPNRDLAVAEINVLDPQAQTFEQAQTAPVEKVSHGPVIAFQSGENGTRLRSGKNDWKFRGAPDPLTGDEFELTIQHLLIKEKERAEGLVLGGGRYFQVDGELGKECGNFRFTSFLRMAFLVDANEAANPVYIELLGAKAVMLYAKVPADAIEEFRGGGRRRWGSDHGTTGEYG